MSDDETVFVDTITAMSELSSSDSAPWEGPGVPALLGVGRGGGGSSGQPNPALVRVYTLIQSIKLTPDGSMLGPTGGRENRKSIHVYNHENEQSYISYKPSKIYVPRYRLVLNCTYGEIL